MSCGTHPAPQQLSRHTCCSSICFPVLLQRSQGPRQECGSWLYKELELLGAKLAREIIWFAQCQRGCLERAKQSKAAEGCGGKEKPKNQDSFWFHSYLWPVPDQSWAAEGKPKMLLCTSVTWWTPLFQQSLSLLGAPLAPQGEGHTRPPTPMPGLTGRCCSELP